MSISMIPPIQTSNLFISQVREDFDQTSRPYSPQQDEIRFGKSSSKFTAFFQTIWEYLHHFFAKLFWCFDSLKPLSEKQKKLKEQINFLEGHLHNFNERLHRQNRNQIKQWWEKAFASLDYDVRKKIILEDIKTLAGDAPDKGAWARDHYDEYRQLAIDFVQKLSIIDGYDPLKYIPGYLKTVIEELKKEIAKK